MAELKTKPTDRSVKGFLDGIEDQQRRRDCFELVKMLKAVTRTEPVMWGDSIVGFGSYHYKYASGREGDWFVAGFSPRKQNLTVYCCGGFESQKALLKQLGKHKAGKGCLYFNRLEDINLEVLKKLVTTMLDARPQCR